jgi:fluoride exporter
MVVASSPVAWAAVAAGAVLGAWSRWLLGLALNRIHPSMPYGTLVANVAGGLLVGVAIALLARRPDLGEAWRLFIITGFLGGLTTFSTFSAESLLMLQRGQWSLAAAHSALHLFGCLAAAAVGYRLAS